MQFEILTLFPEMFSSFLEESLIRQAIEKQLIHINLYNFRQHGLGKHKQVDGAPYGGGPGMVLKVEPVYNALQNRKAAYQAQNQEIHTILLTPQGVPFSQKKAWELHQLEAPLVMICGRYEGFDERIRSYADEEISGGDFVCLGGEVVAMMMIEVISRLIPGVLGNQLSSEEESFSTSMLEYPQYTRPMTFDNNTVPEVLLSGHHQKIAEWRKEQALKRTTERRPDLLELG